MVLILPGTVGNLPRSLFLPSFDCSSSFAFSDLGGLLVVFATMYFGEDTGFFTCPFKAPHRDVERLVVSHFYGGHTIVWFLFREILKNRQGSLSAIRYKVDSLGSNSA